MALAHDAIAVPSSQTASKPTALQNALPNGFIRSALRSRSATQLPTMSSGPATSLPSDRHDRSRSDTLGFNTLSRTPTPSSESRTPVGTASTPNQDSEVAALTTKLINSVNHGTDLEDSLQSARGDLESARVEIHQLRAEILEERQKRVDSEKAKKKLEDEVDDLTQQLFVEAQNMVTLERRKHEDTEQRNEQLKGQLKDAETLLASHQDQLRELKEMLQQNQWEQAPSESSINPSHPATPVVGPTGRNTGVSDSNQASVRSPQAPVVADHPLSFSSLITPVLRTDLQGYEDFIGLLEAGRKAQPSSRANSGNFSGLNVIGISSLSNFRQSSVTKPPPPVHSNSTSSLATSSPLQPHIPGAFHASSPADVQGSPTITSSLKDQKFYKRAVQEDIDPTLRLETAPGLSFFSKRNVVSSMASGTLFVEPFGPTSRYWNATLSCALCGEDRNEEPYIRKHRFRTSDSDDAQRYMVCDYCLARLQATGDFVNFLRMVRSGFWKSETPDDVRVAWEQCTRLREKMFWARIGGGVIPVQQFDHPGASPRKIRQTSAEEEIPEEPPSQEEDDIPVAFLPRDITRLGPASAESLEPPRPNTSSASFQAARSRFEAAQNQMAAGESSGLAPTRRPSTAPYGTTANTAPSTTSSSPLARPTTPRLTTDS